MIEERAMHSKEEQTQFNYEEIFSKEDEVKEDTTEMLSIPNMVKLKCVAAYFVEQTITLFQLLAIFSTLDLFLIACILFG